MKTRIVCSLTLLFLAGHGLLQAQNFSGDARKIGLGGIGYSENVATKMVDEERPYSSILIPLGLFQLLQDRDRFDPNNDRFDPVLLMEYAANPLHYVVGRNPGGNRARFVRDAVNGELNRNLNVYRGFVPVSSLTAEGLASPNWGKTIKLRRRDNGSFQGFYVGAGPYLSAKTALNIDPNLIGVLASATDVSIPNRTFTIDDASTGQLALAITGGYRARIAWPRRGGAPGSKREGLYIAANYNHLLGFRYESPDIHVRFNTDSSGLLTVLPVTVPVVVNEWTSHSGRGYAIDLGIAAVVDRWEFGFGANGVANRINWKNLTGKSYTMLSLVTEGQQGGEFVKQSLPAGPATLRVKLPVSYTGSAACHLGNWLVVTELTQGFQGFSAHSGLERRLGRVELRGGGRYSLDRWHPSGGIGLDLSRRVSVDVAAFGTTTNIERQLKPSIAVSLRINRL